MRHHNRQSLRSSAAFTLMEILVAMGIFSICTTAIFTAFRIGTRAFETGKEATVTLQSLRFTIELLSRDLRSVYYDANYKKRFEEIEKKMASDKLGLIDKLKEEQMADDSGSEESGYIGLKTNLRFRGQARSENFSHIAFARFTREQAEIGQTLDNWGAERVHYFVAGEPGSTHLYRQRLPVVSKVHINPDIEREVLNAADYQAKFMEAGQEDPFSRLPINPRELIGTGQLPPDLEASIDIDYLIEKTDKVEPPELVVENVHSFQVFFGHYNNGAWVETDSWDSDARAVRSPKFEVLQDDPDFLAKLLAYLQRPKDNLPAYVRMVLSIYNISENTTARSGADYSSIQTIVWMPNAVENFVPGDVDYFQSLEGESEN